MNQDQNNFNIQGNNVSNSQPLPNNQDFPSNNNMAVNQPLSNNQNINNISNQSTEQTISSSQPQFNQNNLNNQQVNYSSVQYRETQFNKGQNPINNKNSEKSGKSTASLVLGIISLILSFVLNILTIPLSITGLILGLTSKTKSKKKIAGIVLNAISIVIAILVIIIILFIGKLVNGIGDSLGGTYTGDGFELKYGYPWTTVTLSEGQESLAYKYDQGYLVAVGKSDLSSATKYYNCNFELSECQKKVYDSFYDYWSSEPPGESMSLYDGSNGFNILKGDIYYATMDYGTSSYNIKGKLYLLVSSDKDVILSFISNSNDSSEHDKRVLSLLKNIEIYDNSESTSTDEDETYNEELYESFNSLSNWNRYSELRKGNLGKLSNITGGWRILSDSETYWEFRDGKFWWYKSLNDLNDNYWYGDTQIVTGKEGLKLVGLDESRVDNIISQSSGKVTADDIYAIVMTPTKIISDGVDKSNTNITENSRWNFVWIIIDYGDEGIEGQALNLNTYETSYYVKIKD